MNSSVAEERSAEDSGIQVLMHYFGTPLNLEYDRSDPRDEIIIEQQHCGGNTLHVFRDLVSPGGMLSCIPFRYLVRNPFEVCDGMSF